MSTQESMTSRARRLAAAVRRQEITLQQAISELRARHALTEIGASELLQHAQGSPDLERRSA